MQQEENSCGVEEDEASKSKSTITTAFSSKGNIFILDSSNGSIDQRKEYQNVWQSTTMNNCIYGKNQPEENPIINTNKNFFRPVIEVYFDPGENSSSLLLERSLQRQDHPAFPSNDREEARKKIEAISKAIQVPSSSSQSNSSDSFYVVKCGDSSPWKETFEQFSWICFLGYYVNDGTTMKKILSEISKVKLEM